MTAADPGTPKTGRGASPLAAVFAQAPDRRVAVLEWIFGAVVALSIAAPRANWWLFLCLSAAVWVVARRRGHAPGVSHILKTCRHPAFALAFAFLCWAFASALWSLAPSATLGKAAQGFVFFVAFAALITTVATFEHDARRYLLRGVVTGFVVASAYLAIELATSGAIIRFVAETVGGNVGLRRGPAGFLERDDALVGLYAGALNRHMVALALLSFAVAAAARVLVSANARWTWISLAAVMSVIAVVGALAAHGHSESAKLSLVAGVLAVSLAAVWWRAASAGVAIAWSLATLGVVPMILAAFHFGVQDTAMLQKSRQFNRIYIYKTVADATLAQPVVGIGAKASAAYADLHFNAAARAEQDNPLFRIQVHPHNVYLETWFELGAVGAVLFFAIGIALLWGLAPSQMPLGPLALAQFAATATVFAVSYSMWQAWFGATVLMAIAVASLARSVVNSEHT